MYILKEFIFMSRADFNALAFLKSASASCYPEFRFRHTVF